VRRYVWLLILLAACVPTVPVPAATPDLGAPYSHSSGVFSLRLPPSWSAGDLSVGPALLVTFAPPRADRVMLTVYVVRLGAPLDEGAFRTAMDAYLDAPYNESLTTLDRAAMGDGSWRVTGVRHQHGESLPVNVFMQRDGPFFSALEVVVPGNDPVTATLLERALNTYQVNAAAEWPVGVVEAIPPPPTGFILAGGNLAFSDLLTWTDEAGSFHVSGRLANRAPYPVDRVAVRATLYDAVGGVMAEQVGSTPVSVLLDGEFAPFQVQFDGRRPSAAVRLGLRAEAQQAADSLAAFYGPEFFDWEDRAEYDEAGQLHIRGTIWNLGAVTARRVQAIITIFDSSDLVAGYVALDIGDGVLDAGDSARFDAPIPPLGAEPARYLVTVQAERGA
jgi:hypothetical protein